LSHGLLFSVSILVFKLIGLDISLKNIPFISGGESTDKFQTIHIEGQCKSLIKLNIKKKKKKKSFFLSLKKKKNKIFFYK